jgi:hypothetical protein
MHSNPSMWLVNAAAFVYLVKTVSDAIDKAQAERREMKAFEYRISGRADRDKRREEYARQKFYECKAAGGTDEKCRAAYTAARRWADTNIA